MYTIDLSGLLTSAIEVGTVRKCLSAMWKQSESIYSFRGNVHRYNRQALATLTHKTGVRLTLTRADKAERDGSNTSLIVHRIDNQESAGDLELDLQGFLSLLTNQLLAYLLGQDKRDLASFSYFSPDDNAWHVGQFRLDRLSVRSNASLTAWHRVEGMQSIHRVSEDHPIIIGGIFSGKNCPDVIQYRSQRPFDLTAEIIGAPYQQPPKDSRIACIYPHMPYADLKECNEICHQLVSLDEVQFPEGSKGKGIVIINIWRDSGQTPILSLQIQRTLRHPD